MASAAYNPEQDRNLQTQAHQTEVLRQPPPPLQSQNRAQRQSAGRRTALPDGNPACGQLTQVF